MQTKKAKSYMIASETKTNFIKVQTHTGILFVVKCC